MPDAKIRGVTLYYQIVGDSGSWVALTPGSRRSFDELLPLANMVAQRGYRVLLHDRRNCGRSEVGIEDLGSENEIWADDLYELCNHLGASPLFVGGSSAGARLALLFALRHPRSVKGLLLWRVTGGKHAVQKLAHKYYGAFQELAISGGMEAVCESEHFSACIQARPSNRERLMSMKSSDFINIMETWRKNFLAAAELPVVGATEEQLRNLKAPACIVAGNDKVHPPATARRLASLLANSELHDDVVVRRADDDLLVEWDQAEWAEKQPRLADIFDGFMKRFANSKG